MAKPRKRKQANSFEKLMGVQGTTSAFAADMFQNAAARMGFGTPSLGQGATYELVRLSFDYWGLITLFRNHWISRRIVEVPAQDCVKAWPRLTSDIEPKDLTRIDRALRRTNTKNNVLTGLTWGRLFGGAGGLIVIDGQENELDQPLDLESVRIGAYKGIIPFDRWAGISPMGDVCTDVNRPLDFNKPETYECRVSGGESFRVHSSRLLRFLGPTVPTPELEAQSYWGISVLEPTYESITMLDNMYWNILSLSFRANLLGMKFPQLAELLSGLGSSQMASQKFEQRMTALNHLMSNNSLIPLPSDGGIESAQYSFAGLDTVLQLFQLNLAGAAQMPVTRLFGRTYNGLGQAGDGDERIYEEKIAADQSAYLVPQLEKLYPVVCMSELGEVPDDLDLTCPSIRVLSEQEKAELAKSVADTTTVYLNGGIMSPRRVAMEVKQSSDVTGIGTNLDDEFVARLSDDVQSEGELGEGLFGGEGAGLNEASSPAKAIKEENKEGEAAQKLVSEAAKKRDTAPAMDALPAGLKTGEKVLVNGKLLTVHKVVTGTEDLFGEPTVQVLFTTGEVVAYRPSEDVRARAGDAGTEVIYGPFSTEAQAKEALTKLRRDKAKYREYVLTRASERFKRPTPQQEAQGYELGDPRLSLGFFVLGERSKAKDERFSARQFPEKYKGCEIAYRNGTFTVRKDGMELGKFASRIKAQEFVDGLAVRAEDVEFKESEHPRAANGQFGQGAGTTRGHETPDGELRTIGQRANFIKKDLGVSSFEAHRYAVSVTKYSSAAGYRAVRDGSDKKTAAALDDYIADAPKWDGNGPVYRGLSLSSEELSSLTTGAQLDMRGASSWSSKGEVAADYAGRSLSSWDKGKKRRVLLQMDKADSGASIKHLSDFSTEDEVLLPSTTKYEVVGTSSQRKKREDGTTFNVTVLRVKEVA